MRDKWKKPCNRGWLHFATEAEEKEYYDFQQSIFGTSVDDTIDNYEEYILSRLSEELPLTKEDYERIFEEYSVRYEIQEWTGDTLYTSYIIQVGGKHFQLHILENEGGSLYSVYSIYEVIPKEVMQTIYIDVVKPHIKRVKEFVL